MDRRFNNWWREVRHLYEDQEEMAARAGFDFARELLNTKAAERSDETSLYEYIKQVKNRGDHVMIKTKFAGGSGSRTLTYSHGNFIVVEGRRGVGTTILYRGPSAECAQAAFVRRLLDEQTCNLARERARRTQLPLFTLPSQQLTMPLNPGDNS